jgi:hypothetical protein
MKPPQSFLVLLGSAFLAGCSGSSPDRGAGSDGGTSVTQDGSPSSDGMAPVTDGQPASEGSPSGDSGHVPDGSSSHDGSTPSGCLTGGCTPTVVAPNETEPGGLAVTATGLYWTDGQGNVMGAAPGGSPMALTTQQSVPHAIAVDGTAIYWTNLGDAFLDYANGQVMTMPLGGGAPTLLESNQPDPEGIAIDGSSVYWMNVGTFDDTGNYNNDGAITSVARSAPPLTAPTPLVTGQQQPVPGFGLDSLGLTWLTAGTSAGFFQDGALRRFTFAAASASVLDSPLAGPDAMAIYLGNVYFEVGGSLLVMPLTGGSAPSDLADLIGHPAHIAVDSSGVFFTDCSLGAVHYLSLDGKTKADIATGQTCPDIVVTDQDNVYWTNKGTSSEGYIDGAVMKLGK